MEFVEFGAAAARRARSSILKRRQVTSCKCSFSLFVVWVEFKFAYIIVGFSPSVGHIFFSSSSVVVCGYSCFSCLYLSATVLGLYPFVCVYFWLPFEATKTEHRQKDKAENRSGRVQARKARRAAGRSDTGIQSGQSIE